MIALPSYIDPELWAAFVEQRQAMKVPFTQLAKKLVVMKLMKMHAEGWDANESLRKSAIYGYRDVFEVARIPKDEKWIDPALAKIAEDRKKATPMPAEVREFVGRLKTKTLTADTGRAF